MITKLALAAAFALPLAACNSEPEIDERNASASEVSEQVREAAADGKFVRPGQWRSTVTLQQVSIPGMPPELAAQMQAIEGRKKTSEACLTEEEAKRPKEGFFGAGENCRYERFTMADGKIDAVLQCNDGGASQTMTMNGTYSGDSYNMQMAMQGRGQGSGEAMAMKMRVDAERIGECKGNPG